MVYRNMKNCLNNSGTRIYDKNYFVNLLSSWTLYTVPLVVHLISHIPSYVPEQDRLLID